MRNSQYRTLGFALSPLVLYLTAFTGSWLLRTFSKNGTVNKDNYLSVRLCHVVRLTREVASTRG